MLPHSQAADRRQTSSFIHCLTSNVASSLQIAVGTGKSYPAQNLEGKATRRKSASDELLPPNSVVAAEKRLMPRDKQIMPSPALLRNYPRHLPEFSPFNPAQHSDKLASFITQLGVSQKSHFPQSRKDSHCFGQPFESTPNQSLHIER